MDSSKKPSIGDGTEIMDDQNIRTRRRINMPDREYTRQMDPPQWTDSSYTDTRGTDIKATWHLCGLSGLQGTLNGNVLHPTINPSQWNPYMGRIPQNTYIYEDLPHKETSSQSRNKSRFYTTIKTQNPQKTRYTQFTPALSLQSFESYLT